MSLDSLEVTALTDVGNVRQYNEDSLAVDAGRGIVAIADGMGGHRAGEVASRMAADLLLTGLAQAADRFRPHAQPSGPAQAVTECIKRANRTIFEAGRADPRYRGMGTTLALALFYDDEVTLAHVGDSRIYRIRDGKIEQLTRDHSLLNDYLLVMPHLTEAQREELPKNVITRALGMQDAVNVDLTPLEPKPNDLYLLCSDGLSGMIPDDEMLKIVLDCGNDVELASRTLVHRANHHGGDDNITVVVVLFTA